MNKAVTTLRDTELTASSGNGIRFPAEHIVKKNPVCGFFLFTILLLKVAFKIVLFKDGYSELSDDVFRDVKAICLQFFMLLELIPDWRPLILFHRDHPICPIYPAEGLCNQVMIYMKLVEDQVNEPGIIGRCYIQVNEPYSFCQPIHRMK